MGVLLRILTLCIMALGVIGLIFLHELEQMMREFDKLRAEHMITHNMLNELDQRIRDMKEGER